MVELKTTVNAKSKFFKTLTEYWYQTTGSELALVSLPGEILAAYNGASEKYRTLIQHGPEGQVTTVPGVSAILVPLNHHNTVKGYLLADHADDTRQSALQGLATLLIEYFNSEQALQGMTDELIAAWDQLDLVYRITQTLAEKADLFDALNSILKEVIDVLKVESGFLVLTYGGKVECVTQGNKPLPELIYQQGFIDKLATLNHLVLINNRDSILEFWPQAPVDLYNFIGTFIATSDNSGAALGLINNRHRGFTAADVKLITAVSEQIGAVIDNFKLRQNLIVQERVRRELEIAAEIQESMLPKFIPRVKGISLDVSMVPAHEVGGDFYDFINTDDHHMTILLGDVAGKGIPAAMFTSMARTMLKIETHHSNEPHIIVKRVNEALYQDLWAAELFITAFVATFDTKNNVVMYANAGHTPGIIYHAQSKTSRLLKATSLPLGLSGYDYKTTQYVHLGSGDTLVLYSDGVSEAANSAGERFGIQRIQHLIHQHADKSPAALKQIILRHVADFQQIELPADDITLIVAKFVLDEIKPVYTPEWNILNTINFKYKADTTHLADILRQVTTACRSLANLPTDSRGDDFVYLVELAISEICTNTIEHAYAGTTGPIIGSITLTTAGIQVDIYDYGRSFNPDAVPPPISDPMDPTEGGYGLHIVRQIMDIAEYHAHTDQGNHWKLVKYIPAS